MWKWCLKKWLNSLNYELLEVIALVHNVSPLNTLLITSAYIPIICVFSIAGHGKGEVDHVGGLAKCAIRWYVGTGGKIFNATDWTDAQLKKYPTTDGSYQFHVMVFKPNAESFRAASCLWRCDKCLCDYGNCDLFFSL